MVRASLMALGLVVAGCSSPSKKPVEPGPGTGSDVAGVAIDAAIEAPRGARGAACTPGDEDPAGSCGDGLLCMPMLPGGYCLSFCGAAGTACDGTCAESPRGGELCLASCDSDGECRTDEGYVCDPTWKVCGMPGGGGLAPRFADMVCTGDSWPRTTFAAATQISSAAGPGLYDHEAAAVLEPDGDVVSLYIAGQRMGAPNTLGVVRIAADGAVEGDRALKSDRDNHFDPWLAIDRAGTLHAVWLGFNGGRAPERDMQIAYATSRDGGVTWSTPVAVQAEADCPDSAPGCVDKPMIAIGRDATRPKDKKAEAIYALYYSAITEGMRAVVSRDGGATWSKESVAVMDGAYGDVTVDGNGAVHVVSVNASPDAGNDGTSEGAIEYTVSTDGGATFATAVEVSGAKELVPFFFVNPNVVVDAKRKTVYVAYAAGGAGALWSIQLRSRKIGTTDWKQWGSLQDYSQCDNKSVPNLALDGKTGDVHLTWAESEGGGRIVYTSCRVGTMRCQSPQLVSSQRFDSYSFARHSTKWTGEYASLLVDDKRRVIHALWSQTVDEDGQSIARMFHAEGKLK